MISQSLPTTPRCRGRDWQVYGARLVRRVIASHIGLNPETQRQMIRGDLIATSCRRARLSAHSGRRLWASRDPELRPASVPVEKGKQVVELEGRTYRSKCRIRRDFALVQAFLADYPGNLSYAPTARNHNPIVAMAGATVIATANTLYRSASSRPIRHELQPRSSIT